MKVSLKTTWLSNVAGKSPKKPKQVQMTFNFNKPKKKLDKLA